MASISVAICTYNGQFFIREQLDSIFNQTLLPKEVVVCDDNSSDETCELVCELVRHAPCPVRFFRNARNLGSTKNFEKAISLCSGELIALADQDDVWVREKLEVQSDMFRRAPELVLSFSNADVVDKSLRRTGKTLESHTITGEARQSVERGEPINALLRSNFVTGATMLFREDLRRAILPIPDNIAVIHDGWIALVAALWGRIEYVPKCLVSYRQHESQQIGVAGQESLLLPRTSGLKNDDLRKELQILTELLNRSQQAPNHSARAYIEQKHEHLILRSSLPENIVSRLKKVLPEARSGRYTLYSNGVRSALRDIVSSRVE